MAENENPSSSGSGEASAPKPAPAPAPKKDPRDKLYKPQYDLVISSSPHDFHQGTVPTIMWNVVAALMPAAVMGIYYFGIKALIMMVVTTVTALVSEILMNKLLKQDLTISDGSAAITGLLLGMTLPPSLPISQAVIGAVFAIVVGKMIFGGLGFNIFNPALLGRSFLQASFPVAMTTWTFPSTFTGVVDGVTAATPLGTFKFEKIGTDYLDLFLGSTGGSIGETSALAVLIGGVYLLARKYADWRIPVSFIGSVFIFGGLFHLMDPAKYPDPIFHVLSGGLMLGAFFMATDMVSSPITPKGSWIFGIGAGMILVIIRLFGGLPEGVMYSILLMNGATPLINRYTRHKYLGEGAPAK